MTSTVAELLIPPSAKPKGSAIPGAQASTNGAGESGFAVALSAATGGTTAGQTTPQVQATGDAGGDPSPDAVVAPTGDTADAIAVPETGIATPQSAAALAPAVAPGPQAPSNANKNQGPDLPSIDLPIVPAAEDTIAGDALDGGSGLLVPAAAATQAAGTGLQQAQASAAAQTPAGQGPQQTLGQMVAQTGPTGDAMLDLQLSQGGGSSGQGRDNTANDGRLPLRAALLATAADTRAADVTGGQTFGNALAAATATQSANEAKEVRNATPQQPARSAVPTPPAAQIAVHIVRAAADGVSRFNVQMHPAELGRVEVKLEVSRDGAVHARVYADRQETVDQLQRDSRVLERALQDAGLKADSQNLEFSLRGGQNGRDLPENRGSASSGRTGLADFEEDANPAIAKHWSSIAGSTGALDIRV